LNFDYSNILLLFLTIAAPDQVCSIRGHITDHAGQPVAGARIEVIGVPATPVFADPSGAYCVPPFAADVEVHVLATAEGYQEQLSPLMAIRRGVEARIEVTLVARFVERITVTGRADSLVGISASASDGSIGFAELAARPLLRPTDIMEAVPGVAMTQHSTGGHAPIILLRGYNLDHGTDFATFLDGVPLNLPSHAHAQGYTDTNFLIPELIGRIDFQKGPYAAAVGDFGTAGAANFDLPETLPQSFGELEGGPFGYYHGVFGGSATRGAGRWLYGTEASHYDGPSVVPDNFNRAKGIVQFSAGDAARSHRLSLFSYGARWTATDGYPERALERAYITRFGTLDPTDGGHTQRHLVIARRQTTSDRAITRLTGYAQYYDFGLFSNLTFWTRDAQLGDQISQSERRFTSGLLASRKWTSTWRGRAVEATVGAQARHDIVSLRLLNTHARAPVEKRDDFGRVIPAQVYDNRINQTNVAPYLDAQVRWTPWLRTVIGLRADTIHARVASDRPDNSGTATASVVSPKLGIVLGPWQRTEFYANAGRGFHSNHANGAVQRVDPVTGLPDGVDGQPVSPTALLVSTRGAEVGVRTLLVSNLQSSLSLWMIDSDSELVYAPEAGFTQPERPGRRYGVEWNNFYRPRRWLTLDADAAWSHAQYRIDPLGEGREIPDAVQGVLSAGVAAQDIGRLSGSLRGRYLGRRPLVPDGSVFSRSSFVLNGQLRLRMNARFEIGADIFNILDRHYEDIAYYFPTRIRDPRPGGVLEPDIRSDFVTHPGEPRTARIRLRARF
jgi:outer membrane receptor protein involved in Fe transport